jgi:hypothetical protein
MATVDGLLPMPVVVLIPLLVPLLALALRTLVSLRPQRTFTQASSPTANASRSCVLAPWTTVT